jgi:hypothetical protein
MKARAGWDPGMRAVSFLRDTGKVAAGNFRTTINGIGITTVTMAAIATDASLLDGAASAAPFYFFLFPAGAPIVFFVCSVYFEN